MRCNKFLAVIFIFFFCFLPVGGFDAEDITFDDACYKGDNLFHTLEWWYFDAVFDNGYSAEYHINIFSKADVGFAVSMLNIYQDGQLISHSRKILPLREFIYLSNQPLLWFSGQQILVGQMDDQGNWFFRLSIEMDDATIDLEFKSFTKGWKSKILNMWWWGIIQPKADVTGSLTIHDETINVVGNGYQEHGWDGNFPFVQGWYWGKFCGDTLNVIWTNVIKYPWKQYLMLVVNQDNGEYVNVPVEDIDFEMTDYEIIDGCKIPTAFHFFVDNGLIYIDITAKSSLSCYRSFRVQFDH